MATSTHARRTSIPQWLPGKLAATRVTKPIVTPAEINKQPIVVAIIHADLRRFESCLFQGTSVSQQRCEILGPLNSSPLVRLAGGKRTPALRWHRVAIPSTARDAELSKQDAQICNIHVVIVVDVTQDARTTHSEVREQ